MGTTSPLPTAASPDLSLKTARLNGRKIRADLLDVILNGSERRTIEGASELRLDCTDPHGKLLTSGILGKGTILDLDDGASYALVKIGKGGPRRLTLTFEDAAVAKLRTYRKPRKVFRDKTSRPKFARMLVREAKTVGFKTIDKAKVGQGTEAPGFAPREKVTVKGKLATREQRKNMAAVLAIGYERNLPRKILVAAASTIVVESNARNLKSGDRDSQGLFQQRPSQGWGSEAQVRNIRHASNKFYDAALREYRKKPNVSVGDLAQSVQRSAFPREYARRAVEAERNVTFYAGPNYKGSVLAGDKAVKTKRFAFSRGKPGGPKGEDTWSALQRLAAEVGWRCFMVRGTLWFVSEVDLFRMRPLATITPDMDGIEDVTFDYDAGRPVAEASITARIGRWSAPPGSVVNLDGYGPADGRWLVVEIERGLFSVTSSVKIRKPDPKLPEPSGEAVQATTGTGGSSAAADGASSFDGKFRWPTDNHPITSPYGPRGGRNHDGIDIGVVTGTAVKAAAAGKVTFAGTQGGYGTTVIVTHNARTTTLYAHLSSIKVSVGDRVSAGQLIAYSGNSGTSRGPHLHFEIRTPTAVDPMRYL